ncbi:MAG TPA: DUF4350 domain-containing protein [Acidimicrobiales bacterium]|jgi:hypothetical protein|nr:DUF4350 domain-containing protein [Acidimicrobiales bacterium]
MTTATGAAGVRERLRGPGLWLLLLAAVVALGVVGGSGGAGGPPLDPTSTSPQGAKALALLIGQLGPGVDQATAPPAAGAGGVALVLDDRLDAADDRRLVEWVRAGGTLVTADPNLVTTFAAPARLPGPAGLAAITGVMNADCSSPAVAGVATIDVGTAIALRTPPGATGCFNAAPGDAFLVIQPLGRGQLVLLGSPDFLTNGRLARQDNSVLAANLLAATPTGPRVQWITGPRAGSGHRSLLALMAPRVKEGLVQVVLALVLLALWRARRLGRPVAETPMVELPGSELVVAVGHLLEQGGRRDDAAAILRGTLRREILDRLGVPPTAGPDAVADVVAARTGLDRAMVLATIAGPAPANEGELVDLAGHADLIRQTLARQEIAHVR